MNVQDVHRACPAPQSMPRRKPDLQEAVSEVLTDPPISRLQGGIGYISDGPTDRQMDRQHAPAQEVEPLATSLLLKCTAQWWGWESRVGGGGGENKR